MERFILVTKKLIMEHKRMLIILCCSYIGAFVALGLWLGSMGVNTNNDFFVLYAIVAGIANAFAASKMWTEFTTKQGRINVLMTPASAAEKFWPRLIAVFPGMLLLTALAYWAFVYSNLLAYGITYQVWTLPENSFEGLFTSPDQIWLGFFGIASIILNQGIYIFGSIFWPKRSFLKTSAGYFAVQIILSFLGMAVISHFHGFALSITDPKALAWVATGITAAIGIAGMWLNYWKLKRITVI